MGAYLVRYMTHEGIFFHNANSLAENLREQAGGIMSPALVIHDRERALRIAKSYQAFAERAEVLECKLAVGTMVYRGPTEKTDEGFTRGAGFDSGFGE